MSLPRRRPDPRLRPARPAAVQQGTGPGAEPLVGEGTLEQVNPALFPSLMVPHQILPRPD